MTVVLPWSPRRFWPLGVVVVACWASWLWYIERISDASDEPLGLLALVCWCGGIYLLRQRELAKISSPGYRSLLVGALYLAALWWSVPSIVQAGVALLWLTITLWELGAIHRPTLGLIALAVLSLPLISSMNFFLGYPMRVIAGELAAFMLQMNGFSVDLHGVTLMWDERELAVDAPCSGVRMLWTALWASSLVLLILDPCWKRGLLLYALSMPVVLFVNALRVTTLFYSELVVTGLPDWTHTGVGVVCFALYCLLIFWIALRWKPAKNCLHQASS